MNETADELKPAKPSHELKFRRAYIKQRLSDLKTERDALVAERLIIVDAMKKLAKPR